MSQAKKILVAPLGWGLGHATRCVPIIEELRQQGVEVLLASDGRALVLLKQAFPNLKCFELPSYQVEYRSENMVWNIAWQLPKIMRAILKEHRVLKSLVENHKIDGVISDNRFGFFLSKIPCVFITHQVNIQLPFFGIKWVTNCFNHLMINQFDECWIPDRKSEKNLSGDLSHHVRSFSLKKKMRYLGALTRFKPTQQSTEKIKYNAIAVLSGPEPQRTRLEEAIIAQANLRSDSILIVQGKPEFGNSTPVFSKKNHVEIVPSLSTIELNQEMANSEVFIGRSGYSSIMDLARLRMPALLIPTPGQTEQEYLASKFTKEKIFFSQKQSELNLETGIREAKKRSGLQGEFFDENAVTTAVASFLQAC